MTILRPILQASPRATEMPTLDPRPEGAYARWFTYPEGKTGRNNLLMIERVGGDQSVSSVTLTRDEAETVLYAIREGL